MPTRLIINNSNEGPAEVEAALAAAQTLANEQDSEVEIKTRDRAGEVLLHYIATPDEK